jgi:hypothetical protein
VTETDAWKKKAPSALGTWLRFVRSATVAARGRSPEPLDHVAVVPPLRLCAVFFHVLSLHHCGILHSFIDLPTGNRISRAPTGKVLSSKKSQIYLIFLKFKR